MVLSMNTQSVIESDRFLSDRHRRTLEMLDLLSILFDMSGNCLLKVFIAIQLDHRLNRYDQ